ncbi:cytochrome c biogenesis protein CcdA [Gryllotalpicola daejeonensis]|uniref:Cytochrome c biogenesis protein CcdA n=1 Tax=Gryllotalpicola daejeonensis TaxID=993087 RepID=A0ABP7ZLX3_9MICO
MPGYLAYIGGYTDGRSTAARGDRRGQSRLALGVLLFILGFAAVFVVGGFVFGALGLWLNAYRELITRIGGVIVILLGLVFIGQFSFLQNIVKPSWRARSGLTGAPLLGIAFAIGWSPCTGPTIAAIDNIGFSGGSPWQGALLALCYALGLGIPFLLIALGLGWASSAVAFLKRHIRLVNVIGGGLLIVIGVLMVTGLWNDWMLQLQGVIPYFETAV